MPKINVYLPDELADAVREAKLPVSAICQAALELAVSRVATTGDGAVRFERFTPRARQVLALAETAARAAPRDHVDTEHLLLGIMDEGANLGLKVLQALDIEAADLRAELAASSAPPTAAPDGEIPFAPAAKHVLAAAVKEALGLGHNYVGCEHLLLGLIVADEGTAAVVLKRMGVSLRGARRTVTAALAGFVHARSAGPTLDDVVARLEALERKLAG